jgi:hypothetical protein
MVNTNFTLRRKLPLSPYSMFSVLPERGSDEEDYPSLAQFRLIGTVVIGGELVGMRGGDGFFDGYNPFDLYAAAERVRGKPLPPHLVFAELDKENPADACAFLNAYGPLEATNSFLPLTTHELKQWKKVASKSPVPGEYFRSILGEVPLLPDLPSPQDDFYSYPLSLFWKAQSRFKLALQLHAAMNARTCRAQRIHLILPAKEVQCDVKDANSERRYVDRARKVVMTIMNKQLRKMQPRVARMPNSGTVTGVWGCYSLLEAMYLMLFLDIAGWSGRIAECEKCHTLFYTALDRCRYCSPACENRSRSLRAYHRKQKTKSSASPVRKTRASKE